MDGQIRIALIIAGIFLLAFIYVDFKRRKKKQAQHEAMLEKFRQSAGSIDSEGFDITGVGKARNVQDDEIDNADDADNQTKTEAETENKTETQTPKTPEQLNLDVQQPEVAAKYLPKDTDPSLVICLLLQAKPSKEFIGKDFMPLFLSQGLRHGEMGIFHRYSGFNTQYKLYSVANAIQPGTIDIKNIEKFSTPAFAFFVSLPGPQDPLSAYAAMVRSIEFLAKEFDAQVLDENKIAFDKQIQQAHIRMLQDYISARISQNV